MDLLERIRKEVSKVVTHKKIDIGIIPSESNGLDRIAITFDSKSEEPSEDCSCSYMDLTYDHNMKEIYIRPSLKEDMKNQGFGPRLISAIENIARVDKFKTKAAIVTNIPFWQYMGYHFQEINDFGNTCEKSYHSLYDAINIDPDSFSLASPEGISKDPWTLEFNGRLADVFSELEKTIKKSEFEDGDYQKLLFHPPRIIRAVIDQKSQSQEESLITLLEEAIDLNLSIYRNTEGQLKRLQDLKEKMATKDMLDLDIVQVNDRLTSRASMPSYSRRMAQKIYMKTQEDILFIALAHGGVSSGMDVFLRYCDLARADASEFYAVRLSTTKKEDKVPQILDAELNMLKEKSQGKTLIVFDEDSCSRNSIRRAYNFFKNNLEADKSYMGINLYVPNKNPFLTDMKNF